MGHPAATVRQGWRFGTGLRRFVRDPVTRDRALAELRSEVDDRAELWLASLDRLVWSVPSSPYLPLLAGAAVDRDTVVRLVRSRGVEGALEDLRDRGVYITYEEYLGAEPIERAARPYRVTPASFHNPTIAPDYLGATGGTRSGGTPVAVSFAEKRHSAQRTHLFLAAYGDDDSAPGAVWLPCLPSAAGLATVLQFAGAGDPPERWFSQVPTAMDGIPLAKRLTNTMLPAVGFVARVPLPGPEHVPSADPEPVLDWCAGALARTGRARLSTYPSCAVRLAASAQERHVDLTGLTVLLVGEPPTIGRRREIERTGAVTIASYACMQLGAVAYSCPEETAERYHVCDGKVAVVTRLRHRADGIEVPALLWTTFSSTARGVFVNVENDDYGDVTRDVAPCGCLSGALGCRTRLAEVRGMSKVVAGGVTVPGEVLERLVDRVLPQALGGTPLDYQFAEGDHDDQGRLTLRVDPRLGDIDDGRVLEIVRAELARTEVGRLATEVWAPTSALRVERVSPVPAASGKTLPFEPLPPVGPTSPI